MPSALTISAPGSLMLLGEHAVLHGKHALVCAINRRITVRLLPLPNGEVKIISALGEYHSTLSTLAPHPALHFVLQAIRQHQAQIPSGFSLEIESEFSADIGFGSSAAVTVATHAALLHWITHQMPCRPNLFGHALETVHTIQGRGSGADLAASIFGGVVGYNTAPTFHPIPITLPLTALYCGYKTSTATVIQKVEQLRQIDPDKFNQIYSEIDQSVHEAIAALEARDLEWFGSILNQNQRLMDQMGVNTPELQEIVAGLRTHPAICGAKISGSGMGDCAVGIGHAKPSELKDYPRYHLETTLDGCLLHE